MKTKIKKLEYPLVSIIILNLNGIIETEKCLRSIDKLSYRNYEIIILDNGSRKNEAKKLKKIFKTKKFIFIRNENNLGFSGGNNFASKNAKGKYLLFLNNDTTTKRDLLENLVKMAEINDNIAAIQPKILWMKDKKKFDYSGGAGGFVDLLGYSFTRGRIFYSQEEDKKQYNKPSEIFWSSGAAMFIRKNLFEKAGMFDKDLFAYWEEIDLCWRLKKEGYKIYYQPKSVIYHSVASTSGKNLIKKRYWEHRNTLLVLIKNYSLFFMIFIFPLRFFIFEPMSIIHYLIKKEFRYSIGATLGLLHVFVLLPKYLFKRYETKKYFFLKDKTVYKKSIIFQYFFLKKRSFKNLNFNLN